jgi:hypothetical protein
MSRYTCTVCKDECHAEPAATWDVVTPDGHVIGQRHICPSCVAAAGAKWRAAMDDPNSVASRVWRRIEAKLFTKPTLND